MTNPHPSTTPAMVEAPLRLCGYCKTWNANPCGNQCCLSVDDPTWPALQPVEEMRKALEDAREAIASLDADTLGMVIVPPEADGETGYEYPVRDELLAKIDQALTRLNTQSGERG